MRKLSATISFTPCCTNCAFRVHNERKDKSYCLINAPDNLREIKERGEICPFWEMSIINSRRIAKLFFEGDVSK